MHPILKEQYINLIENITQSCRKEHTPHLKEKEEINTDLWIEWKLPTVEKFLHVEELKVVIN